MASRESRLQPLHLLLAGFGLPAVALGSVLWVFSNLGGKRHQDWCSHMEPPSAGLVAGDGEIVSNGLPLVLRCSWSRAGETLTSDHTLWTAGLVQFAALMSIWAVPPLLVAAVWLAWNKRRTVPRVVTRILQVIGLLWAFRTLSEFSFLLGHGYWF
ncbi:MAG: hypothetical protein RL441_827 [Actinomycetota bacterium]|jgi:hypothetical protein